MPHQKHAWLVPVEVVDGLEDLVVGAVGVEADDHAVDLGVEAVEEGLEDGAQLLEPTVRVELVNLERGKVILETEKNLAMNG